jgi:plasmid stabilization system protein ParE
VSVQYHPGAEAEHLDQVAWYESRQVGLGARYLAEVGRTLRSIEESPGRFPQHDAAAVRRAPVATFPFTIIFRVTGDGIEVLAVSHHRRRPGYWVSRTEP